MEAAQAGRPAPGMPGRFTFLQKPVAAIGFVALGDVLFYDRWIGSTLGFFCLSLLAFMLVMRPEMLRDRKARVAASGAGIMALVLGYDPSLLGLALYCLAMTLAVLLPRTARFDDGWRWARRIGWQWLASTVGPFADRTRAARARRRRPLGIGGSAQVLLLPLIGSILFLSLFAQANPIIGDALGRLDLGLAANQLYVTRLLFWLLLSVALWSLFRPRRLIALGAARGVEPHFALPGVSTASLTLSLIAFNAVFALENGLDLAFLWSGAPLPEGVTLAEYAHRGAYPLIATALLAALFVLTTLRPGSEMAKNRTIRRLVYAWIAQNLFLVASTMLRTLDYVEAYSLTRLRIAALIWMALVALGLALICYRIWRSKSGAWLINANLASALVVLATCSVADLGSIAASWNVRHAREAGGKGANLDICYLRHLGASALLPMVELEARTRNPVLRERVGWARIAAMEELAQRQAQWRGWSVLGALRLGSARDSVARRRLPSPYGGWRACNGPVPLHPLTAGKGR